MRWFGGFVGQTPPTVAPVGAEWLTTRGTTIWTVGDWPSHEVRSAGCGDDAAAIIGPTGASGDDVRDLLATVPPSVATRWPGSYTVVTCERSQINIYTDLACAWPIYVMPTPDGTYWASSCRALAGLTNASVDRQWLTAWLAEPELTGPSMALGRSPFAGISIAPAGMRLTISMDGSIKITADWTRRELSLEKGAERLRAALDAGVAVRARETRKVSADCSGGLDSTSICLLAARADPVKTVIAVTVHPAGVTTGGDMDYATVAAQSRLNLDHRLVPLDDRHLPYRRLLELPATDEPAPSTVTYARFAAEAEMLTAEGIECHFTGDGADSLLIDTSTILADALCSRRIRRLVRDSIDWARMLHCSPWPLLREARHLASREHLSSCLGQPERLSPMNRSLRDSVRSAGRTARADIQLAESYGLRQHNPFTDSQVVEAVLSIDPLDHLSPRLYKHLLTTAMGELLPRKVALRNAKGDCEPDHYRGIRANLSDLLSLAEGRLATASLIEPRRVQQLIRDAGDGLDVPLITLEPVLAAETWLRALEREDPVPWINVISHQSMVIT